MKNRKSQFLILSVYLLILLLIFISFTETRNTYKYDSLDIGIIDTVIREVCLVADLSNGSFIDDRLNLTSNNFQSYCFDLGVMCLIDINKDPMAPFNLSLLNKSFYDFKVNYQGFNINLQKNFTC